MIWRFLANYAALRSSDVLQHEKEPVRNAGLAILFEPMEPWRDQPEPRRGDRDFNEGAPDRERRDDDD